MGLVPLKGDEVCRALSLLSEDTVRRWLSASQEKSCHCTRTMPAP